MENVNAVNLAVVNNWLCAKLDVDFESLSRACPSFAVADPKKIGYFKSEPKGFAFDPDYRKSRGIMAKAGRFFRHCLPGSSDSTIQKLVSEYYAKIESLELTKTKRQLYLSRDIKKYYLGDNYASKSGDLGNSCMMHESCQEYLEFYSRYDCSVLALVDDDNLVHGRAIIWHGVNFNGGTYDLMDRIYTANSNDVVMFMRYADAHNIVHKKHQNYDDKSTFVLNGADFSDTLYIQPITPFDTDAMRYPYLDTMTFMDGSGSLCNEEVQDYYISLDSIDGYSSNADAERCVDCGEWCSSDDCSYSMSHGFVCEDCADKYYYCNGCDKYHHCDNMTNIEGYWYCDTCRDESFERCDDCGDWLKSEDILCFGDWSYCPDCLKDVKDAQKEVA
jgi:hypothetical protein